MGYDLEGSTVVIAGATGGLGRAVTIRGSELIPDDIQVAGAIYDVRARATPEG